MPALAFTKYVALDNDFLLLDGGPAPTPSLVRRLCDRRRGVGADGVLHLTEDDAGTYGCAVFNADGSVGGFSGNGLRCAALHLATVAGVLNDPLTFSTPGGTVTARRCEPDGVELGFVDLHTGTASAAPSSVDRDAVAAAVAGRLQQVWTVDVGNPHLVLYLGDGPLDDDTFDHARLDEIRRSDVIAPGGVNVSALSRTRADEFQLAVWERGVGRTPACASAALASFLAAHGVGLAAETAVVVQQGGSLQLHLRNGMPYMVGSAHRSFEGSWDHDDEK